MSKEINDGGNAFPLALTGSPSGDVYHSAQVVKGGQGMSRRSYFAAAALQGLLAADPEGRLSTEKAADWAWQHADKMLELENKELLQ